MRERAKKQKRKYNKLKDRNKVSVIIIYKRRQGCMSVISMKWKGAFDSPSLHPSFVFCVKLNSCQKIYYVDTLPVVCIGKTESLKTTHEMRAWNAWVPTKGDRREEGQERKKKKRLNEKWKISCISGRKKKLELHSDRAIYNFDVVTIRANRPVKRKKTVFFIIHL